MGTMAVHRLSTSQGTDRSEHCRFVRGIERFRPGSVQTNQHAKFFCGPSHPSNRRPVLGADFWVGPVVEVFGAAIVMGPVALKVDGVEFGRDARTADKPAPNEPPQGVGAAAEAELAAEAAVDPLESLPGAGFQAVEAVAIVDDVAQNQLGRGRLRVPRHKKGGRDLHHFAGGAGCATGPPGTNSAACFARAANRNGGFTGCARDYNGLGR